MELMEGFLEVGRVLCTDNYYSSIGLAEKLISRRTHLVGTLRRNRKGIPKAIKDKKSKRGQICYKQRQNGIMVLKWRDKRDLYMISAEHDAAIGSSQKPTVVENYNEMKSFVDVSDQMAAYTPFVRKTAKWYKSFFFHLLTQTAVVNAWKLYRDVIKNVRLNDFKMDVIDSLLCQEREYPPARQFQPARHVLEEVPFPKALSRRRCSGCYAIMSKEQGRSAATNRARRVNTRCSKCKKSCVNCFNKKHKSCQN
ncbi:unnamed protein product [Haemonchus placei]|uniref:DDE_Tnp_1_7 domain-containing protein n=1 Tax=Haemonchus placei TaxID=6290 RepID=A0A0N4W5M2_HAEPC|nr:unnamed protein product [Haemonchus placei]